MEPAWKIIRAFRDKAGFHADKPTAFFKARADIIKNETQVTAALEEFQNLMRTILNAEPKELPELETELDKLLDELDSADSYHYSRAGFKKYLMITSAPHEDKATRDPVVDPNKSVLDSQKTAECLLQVLSEQESSSTNQRDRVEEILKEQISLGKPITYSKLAAKAGLRPMDGAWQSHPLYSIFGVLDQADYPKPLRTSAVVSEETGMPGPGYFETLGRLRGREISKGERDAVWISQIRDLFHPVQ